MWELSVSIDDWKMAMLLRVESLWCEAFWRLRDPNVFAMSSGDAYTRSGRRPFHVPKTFSKCFVEVHDAVVCQ